MILPSPEIWHRDDFPLLATWRKLDTVVEIGVDRGCFSETFMKRAWNLRHYIGVDDYESHDENPCDRASDMMIAACRYQNCGHVGTLLKTTSSQFASSIESGKFGHIKERKIAFVYIDASHEYEDVKSDIETWWPLIRDDGILAGHDFDQTHPGVIKAVEEFSKDKVIYFTPDHPNSWYCYKSGMPGPEWKRT